MSTAGSDQVASEIRARLDQLLEREDALLRELARRWLEIEQALAGEIDALATVIAQQPTPPTQGQIMAMQRYQRLLAQAQAQVAEYSSWAAGAVGEARTAAAIDGLAHAVEAIETLLVLGGRASVGFDRLPIEAIETLVGLASGRAPLAELFRAVWPDAADGLTRLLVAGLARGLNPVALARAMRDGFGLGYNRAITIARTEVLRSYREATREQYAASGVVTKYKRLATHDGRGCLGCLFSEGQLYDVGQTFDEHPQGRCTLVPVVVGVPEPQFETGQEWFRRQPAERQREILGPRRFALWESGEVTDLGDFVVNRHDPTWGGALVPRPVRELVT